MIPIPSLFSDPRYQAATTKLGELQTEAAKLRERFERAQRDSAHSLKDDAARLLSGAPLVVEKEAAETIYRQLQAHDAAVQLQKETLGQLRADISREICGKLEPRHDALLADVAKALRAAKSADQAYAEFVAVLSNSGVQSTFPPLVFRPARYGDFDSIDRWLTEYQRYAGK